MSKLAKRLVVLTSAQIVDVPMSAYQYIGMPIEWKGKGMSEKGIDTKTGKTIIDLSEAYLRPTETDLLIGDASKAKKILGWEPKVKFEEGIKSVIEESK